MLKPRTRSGKKHKSLLVRLTIGGARPLSLTLFAITSANHGKEAWLIIPEIRADWASKLDPQVLTEARRLIRRMRGVEVDPGKGWRIPLASLDDDRLRESVLAEMESVLALLTGGSSQTDQQRALAKEERLAPEFDPKSVQDGRTRIAREIAARQGQGQFRAEVLDAYERRCAISGCTEEAVLEAAHIFPYLGPETSSVTNGLLLRADLHTLFDKDLLAVDPSNGKVIVSDGVKDPEYRAYNGNKIFLPKDPVKHPSRAALEHHLRESRLNP